MTQDRSHLGLQRSLFQLPEIPAQVYMGVLKCSPDMLDVILHLVSSSREMWTAMNFEYYMFLMLEQENQHSSELSLSVARNMTCPMPRQAHHHPYGPCRDQPCCESCQPPPYWCGFGKVLARDTQPAWADLLTQCGVEMSHVNLT